MYHELLIITYCSLITLLLLRDSTNLILNTKSRAVAPGPFMAYRLFTRMLSHFSSANPQATPLKSTGDESMASTELKYDIQNFLTSKYMPPSQTWLNAFLGTIRPTTPLVSLQQTALFRIQAADLTTAVAFDSQANLLPTNIAEPHVKEANLRGPVTVQVLDIEDIGRSRWSQVEALEAQERGETTKGREIIRVTAEDADNDNAPPASSGPLKLLLQDAKGSQVYAVEVQNIPGLSVQTPIGCKLVLKNVSVARGVLLLRSDTTEVLGGKVEDWDKTWRQGRLTALKSKAGVREAA